MSRFLLDVNAVVALVDPAHVFHADAHAWLAANKRARLLTSPIVQNGVVRVLSQPGYPNSTGTAAAARQLVAAFCDQARHEFVPDDLSITDTPLLVRPDLLTPSNLTDVYLLALAVEHEARLATFDRRIPTAAVKHGSAALELLHH